MGSLPPPTDLKRVVIESPFAGNVERNLRYVRLCMRDCFMRGEAPFASHALYTQEGVLDDDIPEERELGIQGGFAYRGVTELTAVYLDYGMSRGMKYGIEDAKKRHAEVAYRAFLNGAHRPSVNMVWVPREQELCVWPGKGSAKGADMMAAFDELRRQFPEALRG